MKKTFQKGFTLIELMIVVAIIGILAAIAIPNFIKFQARSKQSEVKANLKAIYTAQKAYLQEKDRYSGIISEIGFSPERGNRYAYYVGGNSACEARSTATPTSTPGTDHCVDVDTFKHSGADAKPTATVTAAVNSTTQPFTFIASASGNIDNDTGLDTWSISSESRAAGASSATQCTAGNNPAGEPCNDNNDV